jgi:hypothetical protein
MSIPLKWLYLLIFHAFFLFHLFASINYVLSFIQLSNYLDFFHVLSSISKALYQQRNFEFLLI